MTSEDVYEWDHHSDQPHVIRDKRAKRRLYLLGAGGSLKTLLTGLFALPLAWLLARFRPITALPAKATAIGLGVNVDAALPEKTPMSTDELVRAVEELGVNEVLLRVPLGGPPTLSPCLALAEALTGRSLLIDVLQDRAHVADHGLLEGHLRSIFSAFSPFTDTFKIGNAVNRRKWAFHSLDEYFAFFAVAQRLRDREFPRIKLLGGSIIDFELPNFARSVLHGYSINYDGVAALLYVDRRGAPENSQLGANLLGKIHWFRSLMALSRKCDDRLIVTETNWPLLNTEPFAPAVGDCMVDEDQQAAYLARYFLLAFASGQVETVYWHQLLAPGYGLIDNRGESVRRRKAFYALKTLVRFFFQSTIVAFDYRGGVYRLTADRDQQRITAAWTNDTASTFTLPVADGSSQSDGIAIYDITGADIMDVARQTMPSLAVGGDPVYLVQQR